MQINRVLLVTLLFSASFAAEACWIGNIEFWTLTWLLFTHQYLASICVVVAILYTFVKEKDVLAVALGLLLIIVTVALQYHEFFATAAKENCVMSPLYPDQMNDVAVRGVALSLWLCVFLYFSETVNGIRKTLSNKKTGLI